MKNKSITLKFIAIFMMALTLSITIDFAFILQQSNPTDFSSDIKTVQAAEQEGCCLDTGDKQCVTTTMTQCPGKFYTGPPYDCSNVPECTPKTCVPKDTSQACIRAKTVAECNSIGGTALAEDMDAIDQCTKGCCIVAKGMKAEILQKRQCENLTIKLTNDITEMQFLPDIKSQVECKKAGAPTDIVCCVLGAGNCKYGFRSECSNASGKAVPLQGGEFCRDVRECAVTSHVKKTCGTRTGTEFNIYWFDSQGNQEEIADECDYPSGICKVDAINQTPYCAKTVCNLSTTLKHQVMTNAPPKVTESILKSYNLLTGTSECYNFFTHFGVDNMYGKSTGLQNEILHCTLGTIEVQGLGDDRNWLCKEGNTTNPNELLHANEFNNTWQQCASCGKGGALPFLGNLLGPFPILGGWIGNLLSNTCQKDVCENQLGDCVYMNKYPGGTKGTYGLGTIKSITSCFPKYPPGTNSISGNSTACGQCYNGGDLWNLCKESQCEGLGDCEFTPYGGLKAFSILALVFLGAYVVGRFVWMPIDCLVYASSTTMGKIPGTDFASAYGYCFTKVRPNNFYFKIVLWPLTLIGFIKNNPVLGIFIAGGTALTAAGIAKSLTGIDIPTSSTQ